MSFFVLYFLNFFFLNFFEKLQEEKREKLEMAEKQADAQGVTIEDMLPADQLKALRRPVGDAGHPRFNAPYKVPSWTKQYNTILNLRVRSKIEKLKCSKMCTILVVIIVKIISVEKCALY